MFLAVTLIAVVTGLYGRRVVLMNRERSAVQEVIRLGGRVEYSSDAIQDEPLLTRLIGYLAFDDFDHVTVVGFQDANVGDDDIAFLTDFRKVEGVTLGGTLVTDGCIDTLIELPRLRSVGLWRTKVTDAGLQRLKAAHPAIKIYD